MKLLFLLTILSLSYGIIAQAENGKNEIIYYIDGELRYFEITLQRKSNIKQAFATDVAIKILYTVLQKNNIRLLPEKKYLQICEESHFFSAKEKELIKPFVSRYSLIAEGMIMLEKEKLPSNHIYEKIIKKNSSITFSEWESARKKYSIKWARRYLSYDSQIKLQSLIYNRLIESAGYIALRDKLQKEFGFDLSTQAGQDEFHTVLTKQLSEIKLSIPDEFTDLKPEIITRCWQIVSRTQTTTKLDRLVEAIKKNSAH